MRARRGHQHRRPAADQRRDHAGADERGLADPGRPDDREHAGVAQPPQARRDVVLAAEERVGVLGAVGQQPAIGTDGADLAAHRGVSDGSCRSSSCSSSHELRSGVQAELVDQHRPRPLAPRRAPPPAGPPGSSAVASSAQRRSRNGACATSARACSSTACAWPAAISASTRSSSASIRRPSSRAASTRPGSHSSRSASARPRHRSSASWTRYDDRAGSPPGQRLPATLEQPLEQPVVQLVVAQRQAVARTAPTRWPRPRAACAAATTQPWTTFAHDAGSSSPHSASARASVLIGVAGAHDQRREDHPIPRAESVRLPVDLERAEHGDTHGSTVDPVPGTVNGPDTGLIPLRRSADTAWSQNWRCTSPSCGWSRP